MLVRSRCAAFGSKIVNGSISPFSDRTEHFIVFAKCSVGSEDCHAVAGVRGNVGIEEAGRPVTEKSLDAFYVLLNFAKLFQGFRAGGYFDKVLVVARRQLDPSSRGVLGSPS